MEEASKDEVLRSRINELRQELKNSRKSNLTPEDMHPVKGVIL
jgi:hypothetical protein